MKLARLLFVTLYLTAFALCVRSQDDTRATATWQVQKYDLSAIVPTNDTDRSLVVKAILTVKNISSAPASTLSLRISPNAEVSAITFNGTTADFTKREEKIGSASLQRISVRVPPVAPGSSGTASVDYKLVVKDNTGMSAISPAGSLFLPLSFWYPTPNSWFFARGADNAPFRIQVNSAGQPVVSSGVDIVTAVTGQGPKVFEQRLNGQPFFLSGNWDTINSGSATVYFPKGPNAEAKTRAAEITALANDAKNFMTNLLGPAPDVPLKIVGVRRGAGFSGSGTILIDEGVFRRSKMDSMTAMNIAEAVAKLWIGGSIAVTGEDQGAIREGLPRFIATEFIESKFGKDVADVERLRQRTAYYSVARRDSPLSSVSPVDDYYFVEVANKGSMIWRLLDKKIGRSDFVKTIQSATKDGAMDLAEARAAFSTQKELLDYLFDQVTGMNLLVGLPQTNGAETRVALRNSGAIDVTVTIEASTVTGEKLKADSTVRAASFGEVTFKTASRIARVEIDTEKLYPQIEYSDDVAPKEVSESDLLLAVKKLFDKQDYAGAESAARKVLSRYARFDEVRVLLGRALLGLNRDTDASREFHAVLDEKLPSARSLAWANVGLGEIAAKSGQNGPAEKFADAAILADSEYGASLAARALRTRLNQPASVEPEVKDFFVRFDQAAASNRKADVDALIIAGEVSKFAAGVSGSTQQWQTQVRQVDKLDANTALIETSVNIKLLNKDPQTGTAVFRLVRVGNQWKLAAVEMFEVR